MAKKKQPKRRELSPMKSSGSKKTRTKSIKRVKFDSGLITQMVQLPRYVRMLLVILMSIGVTLATFPLLTWMFRGIAAVTRNPDLILGYTFSEDRSELNVLLAVSLLVGAVYYFIGWRIFIGIVGETPLVHKRVLWYFIVGVVALLLGAGWIMAGIFTGSAPPV